MKQLNGMERQPRRPGMRKRPSRLDLAGQMRRSQALQYRLQHKSWEEVARLTGYASAGAACNAAKREMGRVRVESVVELRQMQSEEVDRVLEWLWPQIFESRDNERERALWAVDRYYRGLERKARLLGLDIGQEEILSAMPYVKHIVLHRPGDDTPLLGPGDEPLLLGDGGEDDAG